MHHKETDLMLTIAGERLAAAIDSVSDLLKCAKSDHETDWTDVDELTEAEMAALAYAADATQLITNVRSVLRDIQRREVAAMDAAAEPGTLATAAE